MGRTPRQGAFLKHGQQWHVCGRQCIVHALISVSFSVLLVHGLRARSAQEWNGVGVDWVLNSLAGDAIAAGMRLLAPGGTFVEIGKRDIWDGTPLCMTLLRDNVTFRSVHLDLQSDTHPQRVRAACEAVLQLLRAGHLQTVPTEVVPAAELSGALRRMSQGNHQGKVVIDVQ